MKRSSWSGTHFSWGSELSFFSPYSYSVFSFKCRLLHFFITDVLFSSSSNFEVGVVVKKIIRKCSSPTSKVDCHKMMLMIWWASRYPGRDFARNGNAMFSNLLLSSKSQRPRDKKQYCHLHYADVLLLKKDFEESIASVFKKMSTFDTNEFLPKMSSNRCCALIARIDLAKIMKLMLRVSSESKYSFFKRMVIQHIVENGCSRDQQKLNFFCPEVVKSEFDLQNLGCKLCLCCESSS